MDIQSLFFPRYETLYNSYYPRLWENVSQSQMRDRPAPDLNSIVWNVWHMARTEDAGINLYVAGQEQVYNHEWGARMNMPIRHQGTGMTIEEVDEFSRLLNIDALREYIGSVTGRTREVVRNLSAATLAEEIEATRGAYIALEEGIAHPNASYLAENYNGWSKAKCLVHFGLTHPFQHTGEIGVLGSLLGVSVFGW
jgi:hypothetical protein